MSPDAMTNCQTTLWFSRYSPLLDQAIKAIHQRGYWAPFPEHPKAYPAESLASAAAEFQTLLGQPFKLQGVEEIGRAGQEQSPYGFALGIHYPQYDPDTLLATQQSLIGGWRDAGPHARVAVAMEAIHRLNTLSPLMAQAVQHTTGQSANMAFQAGGPHAQDRAVEAVAYSWDAMMEIPQSVLWQKPMGKRGQLSLTKHWHIVPRGISLSIACCTFPTWNTYPGLFASLVTGNPVVIKPHPDSILPLALTVRVLQEVLTEAGYDPRLVMLAVDTRAAPLAARLATDPRVRLIDFTGSSHFGNWLEQHAHQAEVFTEKAGLNTVIIDSMTDITAVAGNLGFSLSLYSGQMCTSPQVIYIPASGVTAEDECWSFEQVADALVSSITQWIADPAQACGFLGAIQSEDTLVRIQQCREAITGRGSVLLDSKSLIHPDFPAARVQTPLLLALASQDQDLYGKEQFGPIAYLVRTRDTAESLSLARQTLSAQGAIALAIYTTRDDVLAQAENLAQDVAVSLSINLDGSFYMNQSATFSDFHGSGGNPAANTSLTDRGFVNRRFVVIQSRRPATTATD